MSTKATKPLGIRSYGTIPHLPGSRQGRDDRGVHPGQTRICLERSRDKHDLILVQEKLDGSNVSVALLNGEIVPLGRAGYPAASSPFEQHHRFAAWAWDNRSRFLDVLRDGERLCGEWLAQAHGTRYDLTGREPFVAFDLMSGKERLTYSDFLGRVRDVFSVPPLLSIGGPWSLQAVLNALGEYGSYGARDLAEGAVWRVERRGKVDFLAKYVRPDKVDGCYLPEVSGKEAVWNWPC